MLLTQRGVSQNTLSAYGTDLDKWFQFFGTQPIDSLRAHHHEDFCTFLSEKGLSQRTISRTLSALRQFIYFLVSERVLAHDPFEGITFSRRPAPLPRIMDLDDLGAMIRAAKKDGSPEGIRLWTLIELLYATGMRVSELISIKTFSLPKEDTPSLLIRGKGGHERFVFFTPQSLLALDRYKDIRTTFDPQGKSPYLFPSRGKQGHITRQRVGQMISQLAIQCDMDPKAVSPHGIRHVFATQLLQRGVNLVTLKQLLGHQDISTTQIYTHIQPHKWRDILEKCHPLA